MGAIASVLQWHCGNCSLINPTEHAKCLRCGTVREIKYGDELNRERDNSHSAGTIFGSNASCTVIRKPRRIVGSTTNKECIAESVNHSFESEDSSCIYAVVNKKRPQAQAQTTVKSAKWDRIRRSHSCVFLSVGIEGGKRFSSIVHLANCWQCHNCTLVNTTISERCFGCDSPLQSPDCEVLKLASTVDRMSIARCKNCSSRYDYTITPVEHVNNANALLLHKYELLNYGTRKPFCNCQPSMISLSNIRTYNCVPSTACERFLGTAVSTSPKRHTSIYDSFRTKVSRSVSNDSVTVKPIAEPLRQPCAEALRAEMSSWTCANCTLVNTCAASEAFSSQVCEACETHRLDVNKNSKPSPTVVIKVDNWDESSSSQKFLLPKPSYRRSLSEIPQTNFHPSNRRSLGDGILEAATNKSRMCSSISSNLLGRTSCDDSKPLYTYIGISEPCSSDRLTSGHHLYENHTAFKDTKLPKNFKATPAYDKHVQESMYVAIGISLS